MVGPPVAASVVDMVAGAALAGVWAAAEVAGG